MEIEAFVFAGKAGKANEAMAGIRIEPIVLKSFGMNVECGQYGSEYRNQTGRA